MKLLDQLMQAGLIQFGLFDGVPIRLNLQLLPSYPDILNRVVDEISSLLDVNRYERLVCTSDSVPLATALSLKIYTPLVYSQGGQSLPVHDLIGAYDVGHPAILVVNTWQGDAATYKLVENARRVGLEISVGVAILDLSHKPDGDDLRIRSLMKLSSAIETLVEAGKLPLGQAAAVQDWIASS